MFGIGTWELVLILVLALIVLGPDKLPDVARRVGKTLSQVRKTAEDLKKEINLDAFKLGLTGDSGLEELRRDLDLRQEIRQAVDALPLPPDASVHQSPPAPEGYPPAVMDASQPAQPAEATPAIDERGSSSAPASVKKI